MEMISSFEEKTHVEKDVDHVIIPDEHVQIIDLENNLL